MAANCVDDGTICEYCGKHDGQTMYCCDKTWEYEDYQMCHGVTYSDTADYNYQCVLRVDPATIPGN